MATHGPVLRGSDPLALETRYGRATGALKDMGGEATNGEPVSQRHVRKKHILRRTRSHDLDVARTIYNTHR